MTKGLKSGESLHTCSVCKSASVTLFCRAADRVLPGPAREWDILRCGRCGFGWTSPPLAEEEIAAQYPAAYLGDTSRAIDEFQSGRLQRSRSWRDQTEKVALVEEFVRRGRILDVGCGDGRFLWALDRDRWIPSGVEIAGAVVELVTSRMPGLGLTAGGIHAERLERSSYDVLTFWHVLEHLPATRNVLHRAFELLAPGGRLFVSVPNVAGLQAAFFGSDWYCFDDVPRHLVHFSPESLRLLLGDAGFKDTEVLFFSRRVAFHSLKHSTRHWARRRAGSLLPFYVARPFLPVFQWLEALARRGSVITAVCRKP